MEDFKVCIAGSRGFSDYQLLSRKMDKILSEKRKTHNIVIVSGTARGADALGERYARENGLGLERYPADWDKYGKSAGYKRNNVMAKISDAFVIFWDGKSKGTKHMIDMISGKPCRTIMF